MELKVFTMPACPVCPLAKTIASEVAHELGITYREVNMASKQGMDEGLAFNVMSAPSIALDNDVIVRGSVLPKDKLSEEVKKRLENWKVRAGKVSDQPF